MDIRIVPYVTPYPAKGSHLLKEYTNKRTPILDSLVRESVQNSLDASIGGKSVEMNYSIGTFDKNLLFSQCIGLEEMLAPQFSDIPSRFISFKDSNTEGLTGDVVDMGDQNTGNYFKLVLDIGNEQTDAGAGGSCGIGKSLFFRLGVKGFVIYYSRIRFENNQYESRLIALMVENEKNDDSVIPPARERMSRTGIAYWGNLINDNILPITDEDEIKSVLDIFNIEPYQDYETGTTVILPFIDEARLLADNKKTYGTERSPIEPSWQDSISNFLKVSIQRWYFARLNNRHYKRGSKLLVSINGETLSSGIMAPCFKIFQALYNRASGCKEEDLSDILSGNEDVRTEGVAYERKPAQLANKKTGTLAYILANKELLGMTPPNNNFSPYIYCDTEIKDNDTNTPIIGYCRKPGMIVNYEVTGDWLYKVSNSDNEHFLLAIFVLNSNNNVGDNSDLEEYVRKMEPNDHMEWVDATYNNKNYTFIRSIKRMVSGILSKYMSSCDDSEHRRMVSELGKIYSWILPPEDFGKQPRMHTDSHPGSDRGVGSHRKMKYTILSQDLHPKSIDIIYSFESNQKRDGFGMELLVSTSDGKNIPLDVWEGMGMDIPFYIERAQISLKELEGKDCSKMYPLSQTKLEFEDKQVDLQMKLIQTATAHGPSRLILHFGKEHIFKLEIKLTIHISSRGAMPIINII